MVLARSLPRLAILPALALAALVLAVGPARLIAQIEGERGIAPVASETDIEVDNIEVDATGSSGDDARQEGWRQARRLAWARVGGATLGDAQLEAMTSAIVVGSEQIGPRRYIATLGVIFDRAKAGDFVAAAGGYVRSAPMLVIPILYSGGTAQVFEVRGPWQRAWANFQTAASPVDYVRPVGSGEDSLLVTAGQAGRRSRLWWRTVLDRFGAADVLIPEARLQHQWPGGPVEGTFTACYGPDDTYLDSFSLTAPDDRGVPRMLNDALVRIDLIYRDALARGELSPDPTLTATQRVLEQVLAEVKAQLPAYPVPGADDLALPDAGIAPVEPSAAATPVAATSTIMVQFASPDAAAIDATIAAMRRVAGVQAAATSSIAMGGTSVMRVTFAGDAEALATALRARGFQVNVGNGALSIRR